MLFATIHSVCSLLTGSVFDLVNKAGKEKIVAAKKLDLNEAASAVPLNTPSIGTQQKAFMPAASPEQNETSSAR